MVSKVEDLVREGGLGRDETLFMEHLTGRQEGAVSTEDRCLRPWCPWPPAAALPSPLNPRTTWEAGQKADSQAQPQRFRFGQPGHELAAGVELPA